MRRVEPVLPAELPVRVFTDRELDQLAATFRSARPFPHVVVHDVLMTEADLEAAFPDTGSSGWRRYSDSYQAHKMIMSNLTTIPAELREVIVALNSPTFLNALEHITGIDKLIPDPYLEGGGLHSSGPGGVLAPHTDFHTYPRLNLYRRVNVILYLNRDWAEHDGGQLQLFGDARARTPLVEVVPTYGTCVIFGTDDRSVHGFSTPVAEGRERRSIALYYYTAAEAPEYSGDTNTVWRRHAGRAGVARLRLGLYRVLLFGSRALSWAAHKSNPSRFRTR